MKTLKSGLDLYKERGENTALFAEPTNVLSNIAFFAAGLTALPFCTNWASGLLAAGCVIVGLGSTLYHAYPKELTRLFDVSAIVMWVLFYLFCWSFLLMGFNIWQTAGIIVGFSAASTLFLKKFSGLLNGSADYIPVILLLLICGAAAWYKQGHPHLIVACIMAGLSLFCRVIDNDVKLNSGTHFLWHILNGFLMAQLTIFMAVNTAS